MFRTRGFESHIFLSFCTDFLEFENACLAELENSGLRKPLFAMQKQPSSSKTWTFESLWLFQQTVIPSLVNIKRNIRSI